MDDFEELLTAERAAVERFVRFRLPSKTDAEDVLQEVYLTAYRKFSQLKSGDSFKPWIISIARNKCNDYFRRKAAQWEIPMEEPTAKEELDGRHGVSEGYTVRETLELLGDKDKQILYLYFWREMPQADIGWDGQEQTLYSETELQEPVFLSHRPGKRRVQHEKDARVYTRI